MEITLIDQTLKNYIGYKARLWKFTASHDRLVIKIHNQEKTKYINFVFCEHIVTPLFCILENPMVEQYDENDIIFKDTHIEIICRQIVFSDDPD